MELKWTNGQPYERSRRIIKEDIGCEVDVKEVETSAYTSALHHDENTWDILNRTSNKREDLDAKIAERAPIQQCGFNPFLNEHNYADDISNKFLKPVNTTQNNMTQNNMTQEK